MPYPLFDRSRLRIKPLAERVHDLTLDAILPLDDAAPFEHPALPVLGERLVAARRSGAARMLVMGAHVLRAGVQRHLIDLMDSKLAIAVREVADDRGDSAWTPFNSALGRRMYKGGRSPAAADEAD